jgi:hypothetical protein
MLSAVLACSLLPATVFAGQSGSVASDLGTLRFTWSLDGGRLSYSVADVRPTGPSVDVIESSPLGLTRSDGDFASGLAFVAAGESRRIDETYTMLPERRGGREKDLRAVGIPGIRRLRRRVHHRRRKAAQIRREKAHGVRGRPARDQRGGQGRIHRPARADAVSHSDRIVADAKGQQEAAALHLAA